MNLVLERQKIKQEIDSEKDEAILLSIKKLLGLAKEKNLAVLSQEGLVARALASEEANAAEKYISIEELEKEMKNW